MGNKNINAMGAILRERDGIIMMDMEAAKAYKPARTFTSAMNENQLNRAPWACWGKDNLMPQKMLADIGTTGILSGIIDGKARFALCEGMTAAIIKRDKDGKRVIEKYIDDDPEINQFMDLSDHFAATFGFMKDQIGLGSGAAQLMLNKAGTKIAAFKRTDFSEVRFEKQDADGNSKSIYLAADWARISSGKDKQLKQIPLLDKMLPLDDLQAKAAAGIKEHAITFSHPSWGCHYYPAPLWYAAHKWVQIAQGVPEMKAAIFQNSMLIKYMVVIYEEYWETAFPDGAWENFDATEKEAKRNEFYDNVQQFLIGAKNAHKTLFVDGKHDTITGHSWQHVEIKVIDNKSVTSELLPDAAAANSEIAFSMLFNPAIIGASMPSGPYTNSQGGSSVRESVLLQIILHELERRNIARVMNVIKHFNGWAKTHPGLEFIIPATALTTLDTGGSTKPVTMNAGGATPEKDSTDQQSNNLKNVA